MYKRYELSDEISADALDKKSDAKVRKHEEFQKTSELFHESDRIRKNKVKKVQQTKKI